MTPTLLAILALAAGAAAPANPAAAGAAPAAGPRANESIFEDIVAWVNDDVVLASDLAEQEHEALSRLFEDNKKKMSTEELAKRAAEIKEGTMVNLISNRLMIQDIERLYNMDEVKKDLVRRFKESKKIKSDDELERTLGQMGITRAELEERLIQDSAPDFAIDSQVKGTLSVSQDEAQKYFDEHRAQLVAPPQITFREIVLLAADAARRADRKAEAERIVEKARAGEDFATLVKQFSEAPSKAIEGKIGPVHATDLRAEIGRVVLVLPPGGVSDPIETDSGWHVIKLEERKESKVQKLSDVQAEVEQAVRSTKFGPALDEYLRRLWKSATVEVRRPYVDRLPASWRDYVKVRD